MHRTTWSCRIFLIVLKLWMMSSRLQHIQLQGFLFYCTTSRGDHPFQVSTDILADQELLEELDVHTQLIKIIQYIVYSVERLC